MLFAKTISFAPLLHTPHFSTIFGSEDGKTVPTDKTGLIREIETILFPQTKCKVLSSLASTIVQIETEEYPYTGSYFVDRRFLVFYPEEIPSRDIQLPSVEQILATMSSLLGMRYFWGGNCRGIPEMLDLYPPSILKTELDPFTHKNWALEGIDCSGLLYYSTCGYTPRNTSSLIHYGHPVSIEGLTIEDILSKLKPLDMIVWKGHVLFVYDTHTTVESKLGYGVIMSNLKEKLTELLQIKKPVNNWNAAASNECFVIRRWHPKEGDLA